MLKVYLIGCLCAALANIFGCIKHREAINKAYKSKTGRNASIGMRIKGAVYTTLIAAPFSWLSFYILFKFLIHEKD